MTLRGGLESDTEVAKAEVAKVAGISIRGLEGPIGLGVLDVDRTRVLTDDESGVDLALDRHVEVAGIGISTATKAIAEAAMAEAAKIAGISIRSLAGHVGLGVLDVNGSEIFTRNL